MNDYNNQNLNAYLLGLLPAADAEHFDELSFTDENFADALSAAEKDLTDGYVRGELSGATLTRFETYFLASPVRREKVEFARNFQVFAAKNIAAETFETREEKAGFFAGFFDNLRVWQFGFAAAALLLLIFGGWLFVQNSRLQNRFDESLARRSELERREDELRKEIAAQTVASAEAEKKLAEMREELATLEKEREREKLDYEKQKETLAKQRQTETPQRNSAPSPPAAGTIAFFSFTPQLRGSDLPTISFPADVQTVALRLELEPDDYAVFRVALKNQSGASVWQSGRATAKQIGGTKYINISFPARLLRTQTYTLEVSRIGAGGKAEIIGDYSFRNVR